MPVRKLFDTGPDTGNKPNPIRSLTCITCGLFKQAVTPRMQPYGGFKRKLMTIGEAPGETEDKRGRPWQGKTGKLLEKELEELGIDLDEDCLSLNSVNCRPPGNRSPTPHEVACCRNKIVQPTLNEYDARVILLLGGSACEAVLGSLMPDIDARIGKWRGWAIPVPEWNCWILPTFHPSFVSREEKDEVDTIWKSDLKRAIELLKRPRPAKLNLRDRVTILRTEDEIMEALLRASREPIFSFDYEATGLRAKYQKLVSASFATDTERAYAFMWPESPKVRRAWRSILQDNSIGKVSHNLKFEAEWSRVHCGVESINWYWDTMLGAHVVDNRPGLCGLKLQSFLNFGILPYDSVIEPYLKSTDENDPKVWNRIYEFIKLYGEDELLIYNGIDSLAALMLVYRQQEVIGVSAL